MNTPDKQTFDSWSRDRQIEFIVIRTAGSFSPAGIPGFLFYDKAPVPFAVVFERDHSGNFARIETKHLADAIEECRKFNQSIIDEKAKACSIPTLKEFNAWTMMQRSAWIYNEWENSDKPTGMRVKGAPWFLIYDTLGYGIIYHVSEDEQMVLDAMAKPLTELVDDIEKYKMALSASRNSIKN